MYVRNVRDNTLHILVEVTYFNKIAQKFNLPIKT